MKKTILLIITALFLVQCSSIKHNNAHLNDLIAVKDLKSDVDFIHKKLQKLQPNLYAYISKKELDYKFDSLKIAITKPLTSFDFYVKLSPVISAVRQGHLFVSSPIKKFSKKEIKARVKKGISPFSQFDFELFNDKLYITKNKSSDKTIKVGTEVVTINGENPADLIKEYSKQFTSDGFNKTFKKNFINKIFPMFYTFKNGFQDSLKYNLKFNDSLKLVTIKRKVVDTAGLKKLNIKTKLTALEEAKKKEDNKNKSIFGYDELAKTNNRNLRFIEKDSSVAIMKIKSFTKGNYSDFYKQSFKKIKKYNSKTLILDLRDNGGGRLVEVSELYSYLSDSTFVFIDKSEVTSKMSLFHADYFKGGSFGLKILKTIFSPLVGAYAFFSVHKDSDGKYRTGFVSKPQKVKTDAFKGKMYVLTNGGSFSASSIISSNLKGSKRATFVGEETGGDYNGTVAGMMPIIKLPNSKVMVRIGLEFIAPHYKTNVVGHGIFPDKEIIPTLQDRINNNDPEMNWILDDIKK